jgi:LysM repeat protein
MGKIKTSIQILILILLFTLLTGFTTVQGYNNNSNTVTAYAMYVDGKEVGVLKSAAKGLNFYDDVIQKIKDSHSELVYAEADVYFKEKSMTYSMLTHEDDLVKAIEGAIDVKIDAFAIVIENQVVCFVKTQEEATLVLDKIKLPYQQLIETKENTSLQEVSFKEKIDIQPQRVLYADVVDVEQAVKIITVGKEAMEEYIVEEGDSLWSIARKHDIHVSDIETANPGLDTETIRPGQELKLAAIENLVTIITKEKNKYTEPIPFETVIKESSDLYKGEKKVTQKGEDGEKEIEVYIARENGVEVTREKINEEIIKEPVDQIELKGTKNRPVAKSPSRNYTRPSDTTPISRNGVEMTPWFGGANGIFTRGSVAKVTHVGTGLTFYVKRRGGTNHADCEPLTAADTAVIKQIYGGRFSWNRKPIIVQVGGKKMAASMNGMPHGGSSIKGNNFSGHFCIHFYGSKLHGKGRVDAQHQAMVKVAAGY